MSAVRKKRNFKDLHLPSTPLATGAAAPSASSSFSTATAAGGPSASTAAGGARVQKEGSSAAEQGAASTSQGDARNSSLRTASSSARSSTGGAASSSTTLTTASAGGVGAEGSEADYHDRLSEKLASFGLGYKLELKNEDLKFLSELGSGNSGTVTKVLHTKSDTIMAKKVVLIDAKSEVRKQILRELQILHECNSPHIVSFYGAYLAEPHINMCLEYMDLGSLDAVYKRNGPIRPDVCGQVVVVVVHGLTYLYDVHRIIHRDVKPSNILINAEGRIKICDFGVSGELINSIADTFVGTSTYMSPERILGDQYSVKSDVWSLGISVVELALGRFPFADDDEDDEVPEELRGTLSPNNKADEASDDVTKAQFNSARNTEGSSTNGNGNGNGNSNGNGGGGGGGGLSMFDLLQRIVNEPALSLPRDDKRFSKSLCEFVDMCLIKDYASRPSPKELASHPDFKALENARVDLLAWVKSLKK